MPFFAGGNVNPAAILDGKALPRMAIQHPTILMLQEKWIF